MATTTETLTLLEERLGRVNFVLNGYPREDHNDSPSKDCNGAAIERLQRLDRSLQSLATESPVVRDVLDLQRKHPEVFGISNSSDVPFTLPPASLASLVLAHSQLFHSISTKLSQLQDTHVPDSTTTAKLIELQPRLAKAQSRQDSLALEFAELRARSSKAVESWYEDGVLGMGEKWADWEERLRSAEIQVRRREAARKREEGTV